MMHFNYKFKDEKLLNLALTQSGASSLHNNERLEFIGDRVLGLAIADMLLDMYPTENEGELARRHAYLVSTRTLYGIAKYIGLDKEVRHGHMTAGRMNHMLANAMEAILGAIYIDGGFSPAREFIIEVWRELAMADPVPPKDPKSALQEFVQKRDSGALPVYEFCPAKGESHSPIFAVKVSAMGHSALATGDSKKLASLAAAEKLLKILAI